MGSKGQEFLDKWNKLFQEKTKEEAKQELFHMIADDVVMGAPPYRKKLTGFENVKEEEEKGKEKEK